MGEYQSLQMLWLLLAFFCFFCFFFDSMEGKDAKRVIVFDFGVKVSVSFKSVRKSGNSLGINEHY